VFFGSNRLAKSKPKTSEFPAPREKLTSPDHLDMEVSDGIAFLNQQNFNKSYWQPNMEQSKSREASPNENNNCENETQRGFDESKKAVTARRVATLHEDFTGKCKDITSLMLKKVYNHTHKDTS
jgi:hypothetical protein